MVDNKFTFDFAPSTCNLNPDINVFATACNLSVVPKALATFHYVFVTTHLLPFASGQNSFHFAMSNVLVIQRFQRCGLPTSLASVISRLSDSLM